jgi:hypothetical protein
VIGVAGHHHTDELGRPVLDPLVEVDDAHPRPATDAAVTGQRLAASGER